MNKVFIKAIKKILIWFVVLSVIILIFNKWLMNCIIPSSSMESTLSAGDVVIASRVDIEDINRSDVIIFKCANDNNELYIKRVIGLPGEKVSIINNQVYINDCLLEEPYIKEYMKTDDFECVIPNDCYFVMGDNRNNSYDGRFWDISYISKSDIVAKAKFVILPLGSIGVVE